MMTNLEILTRYRMLHFEADTILRQADALMNNGETNNMSKPQMPDGMPQWSNDPAIARKRYCNQLREKAEKLLTETGKFEDVLSLLPDNQERIICRKYYAIGMKDEEIAKQLFMDQSTVNRIRNRALKRLKGV